MIKASTKYKQMMSQPIRNRGYMSVSLGVINQDAQNNAVASATTAAWSKGDIINDNTDEYVTYATMESDFIPCDGSAVCMPENSGYISNGIVTVSNSKSVRFDFNKAYDVKGLTIDFGHKYPTTISITTDNGSTNYTVNKAEFVTEDIFSNITYIIVTAVSGLDTYARLRLKKILFGVGLTFSNAVIENSNLEEYVSHISEEISYNNFNVSVYDFEGKFDVDNSASFMGFLEPMQQVKVSAGVDLDDGTQEWLQIATLNLESWNRQNNVVTFKASDRLSLIDVEYENETLTSRTAKAEIEAILDECGYEHDEYDIDDYLASVYITAPITKGSARECLQMICNAFRCTCFTDENGILKFFGNFSTAIEPSELSLTASAQKSIAHPERIIDGSTVNEYAEMSTNMIKADGSTLIIGNATPNDTGFISADLSGSDGHFTTSPYIEITLPAKFTFYGIDVDFGGAIPKAVTLQTYNNGTLLNTFYHTDISESNTFLDEYRDFNKIKITVNECEKFARVLINKVAFSSAGKYRLTKDSMFSVPVSTMEQRVKEVRVKIYSYEVDGDNINVVDDDNYYTLTLNNSGVVKTCENPLIDTQQKAATLATWLSNYFGSNVSYAADYRGEPTLQANDIISMDSDYKSNLQVYVEKSVLNFSGAFSGNLEMRRAISTNEVE